MATWTTHRARVASLTRSREPNDPELLEARRELREAREADRADRFVASVEKAVAEAPPLTDEQRRRLAVLLAPTSEMDVMCRPNLTTSSAA